MRALLSLVEELEQNQALEAPERLRSRVEALDRLEAYMPDGQAVEESVGRRACAVRARLEAVNRELYRAIRAAIQQGAGPAALLPWREGPARGQAYDYLDELITGVLAFEEPSEEIVLDAEMVAYQPTPARHIFDLIGRTALGARDVLVDLGSGLGHVALVASISTSARVVGIELEPAYVDCARRSAEGLKLRNVTFFEQDARTADLSAGTVFFLYTPFRGTILREVLDKLRGEASKRRIRVCTFGPCTASIAEEAWLEAEGPCEEDRVAIFCPVRRPTD